MSKYLLSAPALADLLGIREYLAAAPVAVQRRFLGNFRAAFQELAEFPGMGRLEPEFSTTSGSPVRSIRVYSYRIFYLPAGKPVTIVPIIHGAQDIPSILKDRAKAGTLHPEMRREG